MNKEKIKSAIEKTIHYMNGNYYSKFEEKMIVGYLEEALKELEDKNEQRKAIIHINNVSKILGTKRIEISEGTAKHLQNELYLVKKELED